MRILSALSISLLLVLSSCSKNDDIVSPDPLFPDQETFRSTLFVEVYNSNGIPLPGVDLHIGSAHAQTNELGFLVLPDVLLAKSSFITANRQGYFPGSRRFHPYPGKSNYIRIVLMRNDPLAVFPADQGHTVDLGFSTSLALPADGYITTNGKPYHGNVRVATALIHAEDDQLSDKMPGALIGYTTNNELGVLGSYGMIAVELTDPNGNEIQLNEGSSATWSQLIPAAMRLSAPATIPLWYFDEDLGVWREEGFAARSGDQYVGQVKHFSFWNCDAWFPTIQFDAQFLSENGDPIIQTEVCITIASLSTTTCAYTNQEGRVGGMVAKGELLNVQVRNRCGEIAFDEQVGPYTTDADLGALILNPSGVPVTILSGTAVDCQGQGVSNGYAVILKEEYRWFLGLEPSGFFHSEFIHCAQSNISLRTHDLNTNKLSEQITYAYSAVIDADTVVTCEVTAGLAVLYVDGIPDPVYFNNILSFAGRGDFTIIHNLDSLHNFYLTIPNQAGTIQDAGYISIGNIDNNYLVTEEVNTVITAFGAVGSVITGTVSGRLYGNDPGHGGYLFTGEFSVIRDQ